MNKSQTLIIFLSSFMTFLVLLLLLSVGLMFLL
jgi:hypothetical protein